MATYGVDSFHINVFLGDSAIHLRVQLTSKNGTRYAKRRILNAVLIDGGHNRKLGLERLQLTLETIKTKYVNAAGNPFTFLQFDSVVITHWDQDHYQGLLSLLDANYNDPAKIDNSGNVLSHKCDYFKYDQTGNGAPQTTLYVPYW